MSDYAPLRDAFNEMNKLLIDKQQWDAKHELDKEEMGLKRLQVESHLKDAALQRTKLEQEAMFAKESMQEVPVNIYDYLPANNKFIQEALFDKSNGGQQFAELMGGAAINRANGNIIDANGNTIRLAKGIAAQRAGAAYGVVSQYLDPEEHVTGQLTELDNQINNVETQINKIPVTDVAARHDLKTQLADLRNQRKAQINKLEPEQLEVLYRQRSKAIETLVLREAAAGVDQKMLAALQGAAQRANQDWMTIQQRVINKENKKMEDERRRDEALQRSLDRRQASLDTIEAARIRAAGGTEKSTQRLAVQLNDKGDIVDSQWVNVPKDAKGSYTPEVATDNKLKGYVWHEMSKDIEDKLKGKDINLGVVNTAIDSFLKTENIMGATGLAPADQARKIGTILQFKSTGKGNELQDAARAWQKVVVAEEAFWQDIVPIAMQRAKDLKIANVKNLPASEWNEIAEMMARSKESDYYKDFGYIPKYEHIQSLQRNAVNSNMRSVSPPAEIPMNMIQ